MARSGGGALGGGDDEVVCVADERVLPRDHRRIERVQVQIRQQRRYDGTLGNAATYVAPAPTAVDDAHLKPQRNQPDNGLAGAERPQVVDQQIVRERTEAVVDVAGYDPTVLQMPDVVRHAGDSPDRPATGTVAVAAAQQAPLDVRLEDRAYRLLHDLVADAGQADGASLRPRTVFRDSNLAGGFGDVSLLEELPPEAREVRLPIPGEIGYRLAVDAFAGCLRLHAPPRVFERPLRGNRRQIELRQRCHTHIDACSARFATCRFAHFTRGFPKRGRHTRKPAIR